jgi:type II secretory pathway pseudopilin PulG
VDGDRGASRAGDGGFSLVETVIAITLIALVVVPLIGAVTASVQASSRNYSTGRLATVIQNATDKVTQSPIVCDYNQYVQSAALTVGWPSSTASAVVEWYDADPSSPTVGQWRPGCSRTGAIDSTDKTIVQRVTIVIHTPGDQANDQVQVVKKTDV